jgi:hypothetical protein
VGIKLGDSVVCLCVCLRWSLTGSMACATFRWSWECRERCCCGLVCLNSLYCIDTTAIWDGDGRSKAYLASTRSSTWLHIATNKSKNSFPPISISICIVPLRLNVFLLRIMRAR